MAINKNFVVKNGLEVNTDLILANASTNRVGIGSTMPTEKLDVAGTIAAENVIISGFSTVSQALNVGVGGTLLTAYYNEKPLIGIGTPSPNYLLDVRSSVSTGQTALYVYGDVEITGDIKVDDINLDRADISQLFVTKNIDVTNSGTLYVTGITTLTDLNVTGLTSSTNLKVTGISTVGGIKISSGIITSSSTGIVTFYGDGSYLSGNARNLTATIGIGTSGGPIGYGVSFLDLRGPGLSTVFYNNSTGIATIFLEGGGGGGTASIGIGSTPGDAFSGIVTEGNLWYNTNLGKLFIYYQDSDSAQWVDASPFNVGIITTQFSSIILDQKSPESPSISFTGDSETGLYSPGSGEQSFVSLGSTVLNINQSGINVIGFVTATDFNSLSDVNHKENINTIDDALSTLEKLRGVKFSWKETHDPSYGVIAQELEKVLPELVRGENPKTVNYNGIIGILIEAIKELKKEIDELKRK